MVNVQAAAAYLTNNTNLVDEVHGTSGDGPTVTIEGTRRKRDGDSQEVTVEVNDSGRGEFRYAVSVRAPGVETIATNPAATLADALSNADAHSSGLG